MARRTDWHPADDDDHVDAADVLQPDEVRIFTARRMSLEGVESVVLVECAGTHPKFGEYRFALELPLDAAEMIGAALQEAKDQ